MEVIPVGRRGVSPEHAREQDERAGRALFAAALCAFVGIAVPLVIRGAPLADDFNNCVAPVELGFGGFMVASWHLLGAIRPARFLEILLTGSICRSLPFGVAIVLSLIATLAVAWQVRGLLRDLGVPQLWADVGGALWLLQPLGTEAGRWRAAAISAAIGVLVIATFFIWPGANPRLRTGALAHLTGLIDNPTFYVGYPAVGLGLHSIPLAIVWAFPWSVAVLLAAAILGWRIGPQLVATSRPVDTRERIRGLTAFAAIIVL